MYAERAANAVRSAAVIVACDLGPGLPAQAEASLAVRDTSHRPDRYLDLTSLASLIVSIAALAWTIYNDQRDHTPAHGQSPSPGQVRIISGGLGSGAWPAGRR